MRRVAVAVHARDPFARIEVSRFLRTRAEMNLLPDGAPEPAEVLVVVAGTVTLDDMTILRRATEESRAQTVLIADEIADECADMIAECRVADVLRTAVAHSHALVDAIRAAAREVAGTAPRPGMPPGDGDEEKCVGSAFGQRLVRCRRAAGLSQAALARLSGLSARTLRELESGRARAAQARSAELLADALGLAGDEWEGFLRLAGEGRRRPGRSACRDRTNALPAAAGFAGRRYELDRLCREPLAISTVAIVGPPGVGKTALAAEAVRRLAPRFPDGCLAIDLRGLDDRPAAPRDVLGWLLAELGVPAARIPAGEGERASLFRTSVRDRRMLIVLDNAAGEAQVRSLLGTGRAGMTLVTSRRMLSGLESARWLPIDPLPEASAIEVVSAVAGYDVVLAEPAATAELVKLCGNLPLAIRIAAQKLVEPSSWTVADVVESLRDETTRLDALSAGERRLRTELEASIRRLSSRERWVLLRLGSIAETVFDDERAAAATQIPVREVRVILDELAESSLLVPAETAGRWKVNELARLFARECLTSEGNMAAQSLRAPGRECEPRLRSLVPVEPPSLPGTLLAVQPWVPGDEIRTA
jgi:transcriptional regulator with XRE-family HTH domain